VTDERTERAWNTRRPLLAEASILVAAATYGLTFAIVQDALEDTTPVGFILLRFAIGAAVLAPLAVHQQRRWLAARGAGAAAGMARAIVAFGIVGFLGYAFQNAGLEHTTTSNSAFITGFYVVFAPLVETVATRRRPATSVLIAVAGAVLGLFLLTGARLDLNRGDALTLGCAFFFGWWIYLGGEYANRFHPVVLTTGQMGIFVVLSAPVVAVQGIGSLSGRVLGAALLTGIAASALAFTLQLWGQQRVEPARAGVILMLEPVVAGIVGYAIGERLGASGYVGALVILGAIVLAESRVWRAGAPPGTAGVPAAGPAAGAAGGLVADGPPDLGVPPVAGSAPVIDRAVKLPTE
jgi:drug/metabolite transporter (DMT)-like permease